MRIYSFLAVPLLLLVIQCVKESEENQFYKSEQLDEYRYDEDVVPKEMALKNWQSFLKESDNLIFYSRNNLESLHYQIEETSGVEKFELLREYDRCRKAIDNLELKRQQRIDAFDGELEHYTQTSNSLNEEFIRQFKREIIRINIRLGCRVEDLPKNDQ